MPLVSTLASPNPLHDGRQSARAMQIRRGLQTLFAEMGFATLTEVTLATGRRADMMCLATDGKIWIVEIKSSVEDFRVDQKWPEYRDYCDVFAFATLPNVPSNIFPQEEGLILADSHGAEITRYPQTVALSAARRKSLLISFGRAAAQRLTAAELATGQSC
ncbi:MAG: MmcB family DNA repair protein [Pseudomonadota bacterium]